MSEIRLATLNDKERIITFIKDNWKNDHIYVEDESFFSYSFKSKKSNRINFVLGIEEGNLKSILGYLDYNENDEENGDVFSVMWKNIGSLMLGLKCLEYLKKIKARSLSSCGINKKTFQIYQFAGLKTGKLNHYYILNPTYDKKEFKISKINEIKIDTVKKVDKDSELFEFLSFNELDLNIDLNKFKKNFFYKSKEYLKKIYFENPYYNYKIFGIKNDNKINSFLVFREIIEQESSCLRIIDFIGDQRDLKNIGKELLKLLVVNNYEYIDIYQTGIEVKIIENLGFVERQENDINIIPNYFEPFVQKNIEIYYMTNCNNEFTMFKGDGDQDRPSIVRRDNE